MHISTVTIVTTGMLDYTFNPPNRVVDSLSLNTPLCDEVVNIMTDFIVETDEFITLMITGSDLNFIGEPARVVINDDDGKRWACCYCCYCCYCLFLLSLVMSPFRNIIESEPELCPSE